MTQEELKEYFTGHWNFGGTKQDGHIAMFPEELPKRLINMFSFVGDIVLDPFLGSGTTSLAARNLNRNSVGYEINPDFIPYVKRKLDINQGDIFNSEYSFIKQGNISTDFNNEIKKLPYIFKDFHKFDRKTDPKKLQFGSKKQPTTQPPNQMHIVYGILSTALLVNLVAMALDTGHPSVWVIILCAVVIIFAGGGKGVSGT